MDCRAFGQAWSYYLQPWRQGLSKPLVRLMVVVNNLVFSALDRWLPRDERFTWTHLVAARRPPLWPDRGNPGELGEPT